jgi:hypothetical protein
VSPLVLLEIMGNQLSSYVTLPPFAAIVRPLSDNFCP